MNALITGVQGFAGSHLCELLLARQAQVWGTTYPGETPLLPDAAARQARLLPCDLRDRQACAALLQQAQPDTIFHLAAIAFVPQARNEPAVAFDTNVLGTVNLLEAARRHCASARMLIVSSGEVYGKLAPSEVPATESAPVRPASIYAATKASVEAMAAAYHAGYALPIVLVRPFNHIGPRQSPAFVVAAFAEQIARIEVGRQEPVLTVGNLEARRDFTDVRDMVRAYLLAAEKGRPGEPYNIASGKAHSIREVLDTLLSLASCPITVRQDQALLRASDTPVLQGDASKFRAHTGWEPAVPLRTSLCDVLNYWRQQVGRAEKADG